MTGVGGHLNLTPRRRGGRLVERAGRNREDGNAALSLSFVDCISCGLAATIFLLIVFSLEIDPLRYPWSGRNVLEPVDLEVRLDQPVVIAGGANSSGWLVPRAASDRLLAAESGCPQASVGELCVMGFLRQFDRKLGTGRSEGSKLGEVGLRLVSRIPPTGWVLLHRARGSARYRFICSAERDRPFYDVVRGINRELSMISSDCTMTRQY